MALRTEALLTLKARAEGTAELGKLQRSLDQVGKEGKQTGSELAAAGKKSKTAEKDFSGLTKTLGNLASVAAGVGLGALLGDLGRAGLEAAGTLRFLKTVGDEFGETEKLLELADKAAAKYALSTTNARDAIANLYATMRPLNISLEDIETLYLGVTNAGIKFNRSGEDISEVLRQIGQAAGTGTAMWEDLSIILERIPGIGNAIAEALGKPRAELKELASQGAITTEVLLKAGEILANMKAPPPTDLQLYTAEMQNLRVELGENLVPIINLTLKALIPVVKLFADAPQWVQATALAVTGLVAVLAVLVPALSVTSAVLLNLANLFTGGAGLTVAIAGFKTVAIVAAGAVAKAFAVAVAAIVALFSPPVWIALAVGAVTALVIAFREPLADLVRWFADRFKELGEILMLTMKTIGEMFGRFVVTPIRDGVASLRDWLSDAWRAIATGFDRYVVAPIRNAWDGLIDGLAGALNGFINGFRNAINGAIEQANRLIRTANKLPGVNVSQIPQFAQGGYVTGPTIAQIGEGGQPEYVVPASRMGSASRSFLAGARGRAVFNASGGGGSVPRPVINIRTGPVMQQGGQDYVSVRDFEAGISQAVDGVLRMLADPGTQRQLGMG